jgi:hypothetical protein
MSKFGMKKKGDGIFTTYRKKQQKLERKNKQRYVKNSRL